MYRSSENARRIGLIALRANLKIRKACATVRLNRLIFGSTTGGPLRANRCDLEKDLSEAIRSQRGTPAIF